MAIELDNEYGFRWSEEYQEFVNAVIKKLHEEYPKCFVEFKEKNLALIADGLIIHAINYSRQYKKKVKQ